MGVAGRSLATKIRAGDAWLRAYITRFFFCLHRVLCLVVPFGRTVELLTISLLNH